VNAVGGSYIIMASLLSPPETFPSDDFEGFAITPLTWSPHLSSVCVPPAPDSDISIDAPCSRCGFVGESLMCLGDNKILCGRYANGCMLAHCGGGGGGGSSTSGAASAEEPPSSFPVCPLVMSFNDCSIHDYSQDSYLDMFNIKELQPHYAWLHKLKFGEEPPLPSLSQQPKEAAAGENGFYIQLEVQSPSPSSAASSSSASSSAPAPEQSSASTLLPPFSASSVAAGIMQRLDIWPTMVMPPNSAKEVREAWANYSMFHQISKTERESLLAATTATQSGDRAVGAMLGMAIGDAVGAHLEFLPVTDVPSPDATFSLAAMVAESSKKSQRFGLLSGRSSTPIYTGTSNKFRLKEGQFTDDTSMGLCIADSLLAESAAKSTNPFNGADCRKRFHLWWNFGMCNAFRLDPSRSASVGLGGNIACSLGVLKTGEEPPPTFGRDNEDAGNGSIMRLGPVPVRFHRNVGQARKVAVLSSLTTHP
jgi:hypothetical protein